MRKTGNKGFTLIELLVVIAIIGIFSFVVFTRLSTSRQESRDEERISEINQLQLVLGFYFDENGGYPSAITTATLVTPGYIADVPTDPVGGGAYSYAALNTGCTSYHIGATLENVDHIALESDDDAVAGALGTGCPDGDANSVADFVGTDPIYDLKP